MRWVAKHHNQCQRRNRNAAANTQPPKPPKFIAIAEIFGLTAEQLRKKMMAGSASEPVKDEPKKRAMKLTVEDIVPAIRNLNAEDRSFVRAVIDACDAREAANAKRARPARAAGTVG